MSPQNSDLHLTVHYAPVDQVCVKDELDEMLTGRALMMRVGMVRIEPKDWGNYCCLAYYWDNNTSILCSHSHLKISDSVAL